jgi:rhodanese-related sulfurtransferase
MIRALTAQQANDLIAAGKVQVVDVRDPAEWAGGHLPNARLVPLEQLSANPKKSLPKDNVLFVCAAGTRSQTAARIATGLGLKNVYSLNGGTRGWLKNGFQLVNDISVAV